MAEPDTTASDEDISAALAETGDEADAPDDTASEAESDGAEGHVEGEDERELAASKKKKGEVHDPHAAEIASLKERLARQDSILEAMQRPQQREEKDPDELTPEQLQLMDPVERRAYNAERMVKQLGKQMQHHQAHTQDTSEFSSFHSKANSHPVYKEYAEKVENALRALRSKGQNSSREMILRVLLGEDALKQYDKRKAGPAGPAKKSTTVPSRSDAGAGRVNGKTSEERLRNQLI